MKKMDGNTRRGELETEMSNMGSSWRELKEKLIIGKTGVL